MKVSLLPIIVLTIQITGCASEPPKPDPCEKYSGEDRAICEVMGFYPQSNQLNWKSGNWGRDDSMSSYKKKNDAKMFEMEQKIKKLEDERR